MIRIHRDLANPYIAFKNHFINFIYVVGQYDQQNELSLTFYHKNSPHPPSAVWMLGNPTHS